MSRRGDETLPLRAREWPRDMSDICRPTHQSREREEPRVCDRHLDNISATFSFARCTSPPPARFCPENTRTAIPLGQLAAAAITESLASIRSVFLLGTTPASCPAALHSPAGLLCIRPCRPSPRPSSRPRVVGHQPPPAVQYVIRPSCRADDQATSTTSSNPPI